MRRDPSPGEMFLRERHQHVSVLRLSDGGSEGNEDALTSRIEILFDLRSVRPERLDAILDEDVAQKLRGLTSNDERRVGHDLFDE